MCGHVGEGKGEGRAGGRTGNLCVATCACVWGEGVYDPDEKKLRTIHTTTTPRMPKIVTTPSGEMSSHAVEHVPIQ